MSSTGTRATETKSPLDAAQKIVAELQGMDKDNQALAMQFAMQTLRLAAPAAHFAAAPAAGHQHVQQVPATPDGTGQPTDIRAFTAAKSPKSDQQFSAVVAYFYQFEAPSTQRKGSIDATTMKDAARLVKWGQVRDWNMTLNNASRAGYLDRAERGAFKLSSVGENLVAITLPGSGSNGGGNGGGSSKKATKKKATVKRVTKKNG